MSQLEISFTLTGQAAVPLMDEGTRRRLAVDILRRRPGTVYLMGTNRENLLTWSGRGRRPLWVEQWLKDGGTLEQLAARLD